MPFLSDAQREQQSADAAALFWRGPLSADARAAAQARIDAMIAKVASRAGVRVLKDVARRYDRSRDLPRALRLAGGDAEHVLIEPRTVVIAKLKAEFDRERAARLAGLVPTRLSYGALHIKAALLAERLARRRDHAQARRLSWDIDADVTRQIADLDARIAARAAA